MATLIRESTPIAKKPYRCMASEYLADAGLRRGDLKSLTFAQRRAIVKARRNGWLIMPGEKYINQVSVCCGDFGVFKAIPAIHEICDHFDLYEDAC